VCALECGGFLLDSAFFYIFFVGGHRARKTHVKEKGSVKVGVLWLLSSLFPTSFIGNPGSSFVPDGSPITNVGDDGEGMDPAKT